MRLKLICVALFITSIPVVYAYRETPEPITRRARFANGEILVKLKPAFASNAAYIIEQVLHRITKANSLSASDPSGPFLVSLPADVPVERAIFLASSDARVDYAEPNYTVHPADTVPNDPFFEFMWQLRNNPINEYVGKKGADIGAVRAWDITTGSNDVVVAVLDTGVEVTHPDLSANAWINPGEVPNNGLDDDHNGFVDDVHGWNFLRDNNELFEDPAVDHHGTHVAGVIGAVGNNGKGTTGVAWRVKLMALKVLDGHGNAGVVANSIKAINYVISQKRAGVNIRVINASWVHEGKSQAMRDEYDKFFMRPTGRLTRLIAGLGEEKIKQMFPYDVPVPIRVNNQASRDKSNTFLFTRRDPKAPQ